MKKNILIIVLAVVCVISLCMNGVLLEQKNQYRDKAEQLNGWNEHMAMHDMTTLSNVALGYRIRLNNILDGTGTMDEFLHFKAGYTSQNIIHFNLWGTKFEGTENAQGLKNLVRDCYAVFYIHDDEAFEALTTEEIEKLSGYYDKLVDMLDPNKKKYVAHYFEKRDYDSVESRQAQDELQYVLDQIDKILNAYEVATPIF